MSSFRRLDALEDRVAKLGRPKRAKPRQPPTPFAGTILGAMDVAGLTGPTWEPWRTFWRAVFALPMDTTDLERFRQHTGRAVPPTSPVREAWLIVGRRGGKSRSAALAALFAGIRRDYRALLAPGERAVVPVIAADRRQARQVLGFLKGLLRVPAFAPFTDRVLKESVELTTGVTVEVHAPSFRATRGYSLAGVVADELAFWRSEDGSANPDSEILGALRPGMSTLPGALLLGLSTPYAARGELYKAHVRYMGTDDPSGLAWNADTLSMNPSIDASVIATAFADDPVAAASEYGQDGSVVFRSDVEAFLSPEAIRAVIVTGRREIPPLPGVQYAAFVDPSGGSQDSFTLAIGHGERGGRGVLDLVREVRPPFSPDAVVADFAATLRTYRVTKVQGDRYAGEWPRERFAVHGIRYEPAEQTKSDLYRELLPLVNGARIELLDLPRLYAQLVGLERRTARGGRDSTDHPPGGHDDVANAAAGVLVSIVGGPPPVTFSSVRVRMA